MPELPEVELAARIAREAAVGKAIARVRVLHRAQRKSMPGRVGRSLVGDVVRGVDRRGKHQLMQLASGRLLHVHFRMTGDWRVLRVGDPLPPSVRLTIDFADGTCLALDDPRALASCTVVAVGVDPCGRLGPEATDAAFNARWLAQRLRGRRTAIKVLLLDQQLVAGIGNIYASEACWRARLDPRRPGSALDASQLATLVRAVRLTMRRALERPGRYYESPRDGVDRRFAVYDREGAPCLRCRRQPAATSRIARLLQAGRSTYFCPRCQR